MSEKIRIKSAGRSETVYSFAVTVLNRGGVELLQFPQTVRAISDGPTPLKFILYDLARAVGNSFTYGPFKRSSPEFYGYQGAMAQAKVIVGTMEDFRSAKISNKKNEKFVLQKSLILEICEAVTEQVAMIREIEKLPPLPAKGEARPAPTPKPPKPQPLSQPAKVSFEPMELESGGSIRYLKEDLALLGYEIVIQLKKEA